MEVGDAYYSGDPLEFEKSISAGRYTATVVDMEISKNVRFGKYIADVFKPEYQIDKDEHSDYPDSFVRDNGIFRYKKVEGFVYQQQKNWGYAKFLSIMRLLKDGGKGGQLPFLHISNIIKYKVLIDVSKKKFVNDLDSEVHYPVARVIQLIKESPVPF
mgnify:CR=1 FL=1|tara:strand:- start:124 stop:597 length:474 start_codon:yes stop_codon:yes gene_type:complete